MLCLKILLLLPLIALRLRIAGAKPYHFLPLDAPQVYRLLHAAGRDDAVPQGRVVTQGLAAMGGFALGLTKALAGVFIYDVITANVTEADLIQAANAEAATNSGTARQKLRTQEICFNSRAARSLEDAEAVAAAYIRSENKQKLEGKEKVRSSDVKRKIKTKRRNKSGRHKQQRKNTSNRIRNRDKHKLPVTNLVLGAGTRTYGDGAQVNNDAEDIENGNEAAAAGDDDNGDRASIIAPTSTGLEADDAFTTRATETGSPSSSASVDNNGSVTNTNAGTGSGTISTSTTTTGGGATNCVVIEQPLA